jgi:hypothetical protein
MRGFSPVGDKHRPLQGSLLGPARVLIEFPAGQGCYGHGNASAILYTRYYNPALLAMALVLTLALHASIM